jgi:acetyltransferase
MKELLMNSDKNDYKHINAGDLDVTIRPITSDDIEIEAAFMRDFSALAKHKNFLSSSMELSSSMISTLYNIDYINSMAYIATIQQGGNEKKSAFAFTRSILNQMNVKWLSLCRMSIIIRVSLQN